MTQVSQDIPRPGRYRHFKGGEYEVVQIARHSETEELLVVYRSIADPATHWVRSVEMFTEQVEGPHGRQPRFRMTGAPQQGARRTRGRTRIAALLNAARKVARISHQTG